MHIAHNTPYLHKKKTLPPPKKKINCTSIVFSFSWDNCNAQEKFKKRRYIMGDAQMANLKFLFLFFWFVVYLNQTIWLKPVGHTSPSPSTPLTLEITISWNFLRVLLLVKKMSYLLVRMQSYITFSLVFADWCVRWGWGSVRLYRGKRGPRRTTGVSSKRSLRWIYKRKSWHTVTRRRRRLLSVMLSLGFILSSSSLSLPD